MKKKQNESVSIKDLATQILAAEYSKEQNCVKALEDAGIFPSSAAVMLMAVLRKATDTGDVSSAKFMREAAGEADEELLSRPLSQIPDGELMEWAK